MPLLTVKLLFIFGHLLRVHLATLKIHSISQTSPNFKQIVCAQLFELVLLVCMSFSFFYLCCRSLELFLHLYYQINVFANPVAKLPIIHQVY